MSIYNSTSGISDSKYPNTKIFSPYLVLLFISVWFQNSSLVAQYTKQQFLEKRKVMSADRSNRLLQNKIKINSQLLNTNRSQCEFTLDSVHAVNNPLSQIIQSLAGSGVIISNIQTNLPASSTMYGSFSCGSAAKLGLESGLVLTTGSVDSAKGPNDESGMTGEHQLLPNFPDDGYPLCMLHNPHCVHKDICF